MESKINSVKEAVEMAVAKKVEWLKARGERALELETPEWVNGNLCYVPSFNPDGTGKRYYKVSVRKGHENCTCEDWIYRGRSNGIPCKHLLRAIAEKVVKEANQLPKDLAENMKEADEAVKRGELPAHAPEHVTH